MDLDQDSAQGAAAESVRLGHVHAAFHENITALRAFAATVGAFTVDLDKKTLDEVIAAMRRIRAALPSDTTDSDGVHTDSEGDEEAPTASSETSTSEKNRPERLNSFELYDAVQRVRRQPSSQTKILRTGTVVTLVSHFEALVSDLLHAYYSLFPQALPSTDATTISLEDLRRLGTIPDAEQFIREREIEAVLRGGIEAQLNYFRKRPKINIDQGPMPNFLLALAEVSKRRNLYVHNQGIVNRHYMETVDGELSRRFEVALGNHVGASSEYINHAIDTVEVCGTALIQLCWRSWQKAGVGVANGALVDVSYEALVSGRLNVVKALSDFCLATSYGDDETKRKVCVNHAIALRDNGEADKIAPLLDRFDWSTSNLLFRLAYAAVTGDEDSFFDLLPRAVAAEEIHLHPLLDWPLFSEVQSSSRWEPLLIELFSLDEVRKAQALLYQDLLSQEQAASEPEAPGEVEAGRPTTSDQELN